MAQPSGVRKRSISQTQPTIDEPPTKRILQRTLESVPDDLDNDSLDKAVLATWSYDTEPFKRSLATFLLITIVSTCGTTLNRYYQDLTNAEELIKMHPQLIEMLEEAWGAKTFRKIRNLKILRSSTAESVKDWDNTRRQEILLRLGEAYNTPFVGSAATDFCSFLSGKENDVQRNKEILYAKAIPIVQSSGTGKSRMLTEVGKYIFTLPICLRRPNSPGYPQSDKAVWDYFALLTKDNDLSFSVHAALACFLAALHGTMLRWLKVKWEEGCNRSALLTYWQTLMEKQLERDDRQRFFSEVVKEANALRRSSGYLRPVPSPRRGGEAPDAPGIDIVATARDFYNLHAKGATEALTEFVAALGGNESHLCVTYFDEADELDMQFWILLRLLGNQDELTAMWYVFMATKSRVTYFAPMNKDFHSLRLKDELKHLLAPYFALGFDHNVITDSRAPKRVTMGELQGLEHLCQFGRPLWYALYPREKDGVLELAKLKLTNGRAFDDQNTDHVFAVLSQRVCLEPVLAASEAIELADRSVAHHMRLLTGVSPNHRMFYTYSPSEPVLALAAMEMLYSQPKGLAPVLDTLNKKLCESGLVDRGLMGEFCARILLLIACDLATPKRGRYRGSLVPVPLLEFLDHLFGAKSWCGEDRNYFEQAFCSAYINFTHWIVTRDPLPEVPDPKLLANLWARHAALQCCFNQESLDLLIVQYIGSIEEDAIFDPAALSVIIIQVRFKSASDTGAGDALRPIGIPRDLRRPLPYLAMLLELGNESRHQSARSKIKCIASEPVAGDIFEVLTADWLAAVKMLKQFETKTNKKQIAELKAVVEAKRRMMDSCNRFSIFVRGSSSEVYGILEEAGISEQFATLLRITMPSPTDQDRAAQTMRPLERLGYQSAHTSWMSEYVVRDEENNDQGMLDKEGDN